MKKAIEKGRPLGLFELGVTGCDPPSVTLRPIVTEDLAGAMVSIRWRVTRIANWQGKEAPTLEDIGRLYVFLRTFQDDYIEIEHCLRDIRESLYELDHVRIQENVDPDAKE